MQDVEVVVEPPHTASDHVLKAVELVGLEKVLDSLCAFFGRAEVKRAFNRPGRPSTDLVRQVRRHALDIFVTNHGGNAAHEWATLVTQKGGVVRALKDEEASKRKLLVAARKRMESDPEAGVGARALAAHWEETIGKKGVGWRSFVKSLELEI